MEGKIIKTQDLAALLHAIARNPKGQQLAWNFVRENWTHLLKKLVFTYLQCVFFQPSQLPKTNYNQGTPKA